MTSKSVEERFSGHLKDALKKSSPLPVHKAIRKYQTVCVECLCVSDKAFILDLERKVIAAFNTRLPNGYNVSFGGDSSPSQTPEFKAIMSSDKNPMKRPEVKAARSGAHHHMKTEEQRKRASEQQKARNNMASEEARARSSASHKGKPSPRKGVKLSAEQIAKISAAGKGKSKTKGKTWKIKESSRLKISAKTATIWATRLGIPFSIIKGKS